MSDEDLWWRFLHHRVECSNEFWEEVENRKAAGTLSKGSPFWTIGSIARYLQRQGTADSSNLIELTREEWEARRRTGGRFCRTNQGHSRSEFYSQGDSLAFSGKSQSSADHENPEVFVPSRTGSGGKSILRLFV